VQQMTIMEALFNPCGNQIKHCVKMEQREPPSDPSTTPNSEITTSHPTRKRQIIFENNIGVSKTSSFLFHCSSHTKKYLVNGIHYRTRIWLIGALQFVKIC